MNTLKRLWVCALTLASFSLAGLLGNVDAKAADIITYYHNDISGTPLLATDAAGNVLWKENYQPYGDKLNKQPASAGNKVGFAGKPYDGNTGLSYMGARYYDPVIGRFMGIDPKGFDEGNLQSFNRYAYANNNPYKFVDPDGRSALLAVVAVGLWLGAEVLIPSPDVPWNSGQVFSTSLPDMTSALKGASLGIGLVGAIKQTGTKEAIESVAGKAVNTAEVAAAARAENLAKGIPAKELGPSGKPKIHIVEHTSLKEAKDAARAEVGAGGTTVKHANPKVGESHFHGATQGGSKDRIHHEY